VLTNDLRRHANKFYGKYRGIVAENADEHYQGLLRVHVPSVFGEAAVVQAKACMPYGHYFVPPIDSLVWVEFEEGNRESPIWSGAWLPKGKAPAEAQLSPPDARVIQTAAGHTIRIVDKKDEEQILIRHSSDAFVSIDAKGSILLSNSKGSHIHLDAANGAVTVVEQHGNHLKMTESGTAVVTPKGTALNMSGETVHVVAKDVVLEASSVGLGVGASEPTIMGNAFDVAWQVLLKHVHPSAMGPTSPSVELQPLQLLPGTHYTSAVTVK
jgi:hypothetical protein